MKLFQGAARVPLEGFIFLLIQERAHKRKKATENLLKSFRQFQPNLKYQIRTGKDDIKLMLKIQEKNDFLYWKEVPLEYIDAFNEIPEMELETPDPESAENSENNEADRTVEMSNPGDNEGWETATGKRKNMSPIQLERKKKKQEFSPENMAL